jgi:FtsH-binding integral membrane protein
MDATIAASQAPVAEVDVTSRTAFLRRTYTTLFVAIAAFTALLSVFVNLPITPQLVQMMGGSRWGMLLLLAGFMGVAWFAQNLANSGASKGTQTLGLCLYVVAQAVICTPLVFVAAKFGPPNTLLTAGVGTLAIFAALTAVVFITKADFSFLRTFLFIAGAAAMIGVLASIAFGFSLGIWFTVGMIFLAALYISYYTSMVMHQFRTDQSVAAALALFAAVVLLFYYVLLFLLQRRQ